MKKQMHWLRKEEFKLAQFLKTPNVDKATSNDYFKFLIKFFDQGGKLTSYSDNKDYNILIVDSGIRIPNLISIAARKIIVRQRKSFKVKASKSFNNKADDIGENIIYNMEDGSVDGYNRLFISKNILSLLKFSGLSLEDILDLFHEDKKLPESLRGEEKRGLNSLKADYLMVDINPSMGLKRDLPLRKKIDF